MGSSPHPGENNTDQGAIAHADRGTRTLPGGATNSQFGLSGTVQVNDFDLDPTSGLVQLFAGLVDALQKIATQSHPRYE